MKFASRLTTLDAWKRTKYKFTSSLVIVRKPTPTLLERVHVCKNFVRVRLNGWSNRPRGTLDTPRRWSRLEEAGARHGEVRGSLTHDALWVWVQLKICRCTTMRLITPYPVLILRPERFTYDCTSPCAKKVSNELVATTTYNFCLRCKLQVDINIDKLTTSQ